MAQLRSRRFGPFPVAVLLSTCLTTPGIDAQVLPRKIGNGSSNGATRKVVIVEAPKGYPTDLVVVKRGLVELGIDHKTVFERSRALSRNPNVQKTIRKLLARELGRERIVLPDFFIGRHEVTNEQYETFLKTINANEKKVKFPFSWWNAENKEKIANAFREKWKGEKAFKDLEHWDEYWRELEWSMPEGREKYPVNFITYEAAQEYCAWTGMRLPTEPEWQRAYYGEKKQCYVLGAKWKKDWIKIIQLDTPRNRKLKPVGSIPEIRSMFGADDLMGNVWEWTQSPFEQFEGFRPAFNALNRLLQRQKDKRLKGEVVSEPKFNPSDRVLKGGSFLGWSDPQLNFRAYNRVARADHITKEDFGFRVAKSSLPTLDAATLWARTRFDASPLGEARLDLPSARDLRAMRRGKQRTYELRGMERWDMDGEIIKQHHMLSVIPVRQLVGPKNEKGFTSLPKFKEATYRFLKSGKPQGLPTHAIFTSVKLELTQKLRTGKVKYVELEPDMYVVYYRAKGLPDELIRAMRVGKSVLAANKGERPKPESAKKEDDGKKKKKKKSDSKRKKRKRSRKGKKKPRSEADKLMLKNWTKIVDAYGVPDEITKKYPKASPKDILIEPGKLRIPIDRDVLIFRKHDGGCVAWIAYDKRLEKLRSNRYETTFKVDEATGHIEFRGGPLTNSAAVDRVPFLIPFKVDINDLNKGWVR